MTLKELQIGKSAVVDTVGGSGALRQHFLDMGLIPGAEVTLVKLAPMGDPMELRIHGYELTLRLDDAAQIGITPTEKAPAMSAAPADDKMVDHPGLGEGGKYHIKKGENPLPEGRTLTFALAGNQNCGKTTLFNQLTGSNQHVGNFPGVTVDRKSGAIKDHPETEVTDLPGIYSMSPYSSEEIVTRQFIIGEKPTGIINIVDATNIERNLYLTMQLMELDTPMVLALNMMDEVTASGGSIDIKCLEEALGIPVDEMARSAELQAKAVFHASRLPTAAAVSPMDLSIEAEAFGARVRFAPDEVPAVTGQLVPDEDAAKALADGGTVSRVYQNSLTEYTPAGDTAYIVTDTATLAALNADYTVLRDYGDVFWAVRMNINDLTNNFTENFTLPEAPQYGVGRKS